jgi:hypothetical protein
MIRVMTVFLADLATGENAIDFGDGVVAAWLFKSGGVLRRCVVNQGLVTWTADKARQGSSLSGGSVKVLLL